MTARSEGFHERRTRVEPNQRVERPSGLRRLAPLALIALAVSGCIGSSSTGTHGTRETGWGSTSPVVHRVTVTPQHPRTLPVARLASPLMVSCHTGGLSSGHGIGFQQKISSPLSAGTHTWGDSMNGATITVNVSQGGVLRMSC
jgi:hypothetical protein